MLRMISLIAAFAATATLAAAQATPTGLPVPRFVSLKSSTANARIGPSFDHDVRWTLARRGLPLLVVAETGDNWRKVRDPEGDEMWIHVSQLSGRATALVLGEAPIALASSDAPGGPERARLEPGVIVEVLGCTEQLCRVRAGRFSGFVSRRGLWGATGGRAATLAADAPPPLATGSIDASGRDGY